MLPRKPHYLLLADTRSAVTDSEGGGKWHFVLESTETNQRLEVGDREPATNGERLELLTVVRGLEALDQPSRVTLVTSSRYVARGLRFGLDAWRTEGWQWELNGQFVPVKNRDLWQRLDHAMRYHQIRCRYVRVDDPHGSPTSTTGNDDLSALAGQTVGLPSPGPRPRISGPRTLCTRDVVPGSTRDTALGTADRNGDTAPSCNGDTAHSEARARSHEGPSWIVYGSGCWGKCRDWIWRIMMSLRGPSPVCG